MALRLQQERRDVEISKSKKQMELNLIKLEKWAASLATCQHQIFC